MPLQQPTIPLKGNGATVTVSTPLVDLSQTWNAGAVAFTAWKLAVTKTASAAGSKLTDVSDGTTSFSVVAGVSGSEAAQAALVNQYNVVGNLDPRGFVSYEYSDTDHSAHFSGAKARGTLASPAAVQIGDYLAGFTAKGHDGTNFLRAGYLAFVATSVAMGAINSKIEMRTALAGIERIAFSMGSDTTLTLINAAQITVDGGTTNIFGIASSAPGIHGYCSNGSVASPTASVADDILGFVGGRGYGASAYGSNAKGLFAIYAAQTWTNANQGTYAGIATTPLNSTTRVLRWKVDPDGNLVGQTAGTYVLTAPTTVASLPAAATGLKGARAFVTDANATTFLSTVAGGGANNVPVVCDGTNWKIG